MKKRNLNRIYYILIIAVVLISMIPLIALSIYDCPSADDFNYAVKTYAAWNATHSIGQVLKAAAETTISFWNNWQGLYVSAFLLSLQPAIFGSEWYALTGILMIFLLIGSTVSFSVYVLKRIFKRGLCESITIGCVMSFLIIQYMPSCLEGLYWFNGAVNYGFFFSVLLIYICLFMELQRKNSILKETVLFLSCLISVFLLEGGNHVTALMSVVYTFVIMVVRCRKNKRKTIKNVCILLVSVVFLALNLCSPGTAERASELGMETEVSMGVFWTVFRAIWESIRSIGDWFGFKEIVLLILILPILVDVTVFIRKEWNFKFQYPLLVIIASVAWLSIMYCPPFYALGGCGADRLINIVYYCYVILLFIDMTYIVGWLQNFITQETLLKIQISNAKFLQTVLALVFAVFLASVLDTWTFEAVNELYSGEAKTYSEEYRERDEKLLNSSNKAVTVTEFSVKPAMLYFDDITDKLDHWKNTGVSKYYGLESIVLKEK